MVTIIELKAMIKAKKKANEILRPYGYKLKTDSIKEIKRKTSPTTKRKRR
jgi:hypothetical protein